jgi:hypothetical protein
MACGAESTEDADLSTEALDQSLFDVAAAAGARDVGTITPQELTGVYDPNGIPSATGLMTNIKMSLFGDHPLLTATLPYSSDLNPSTEFLLSTLKEQSMPTYVGKGTVNVDWGDIQCSYPTAVVVLVGRTDAGELNLFIRDNRPIAFPDHLPSGASSCPPILNTWRTHPDPYVKRAPIVDVITAVMPKVDDLCTSVAARVGAVDSAKRLTTAALGSVPPNIFQASGDWEAYSTPGRDTGLRAAVKEIYTLLSTGIQGLDPHTAGPRLLAAWKARDAACHLSYKSSTGTTVTTSLGTFVKRAYKISFDPYHCPELRWGADATAGAEFATCNTQDETHIKRYNDEQTLRNLVARPTSGTPTPLGSGPAQAEEIDFASLIERFAQ